MSKPNYLLLIIHIVERTDENQFHPCIGGSFTLCTIAYISIDYSSLIIAAIYCCPVDLAKFTSKDISQHCFSNEKRIVVWIVRQNMNQTFSSMQPQGPTELPIKNISPQKYTLLYGPPQTIYGLIRNLSSHYLFSLIKFGHQMVLLALTL